MESNSLYAIWFSLKYTGTSSLLRRLAAHFSDFDGIYSATEEDLQKIDGLTDNEIAFLCDKDLTEAQRIMQRCFSLNIKILSYDSPMYPASLRKIEDPAAVLYVRGEMPDFNNSFSVAVVGARECSHYGAEVCTRLSAELAVSGSVILSGMALGIDAIASASAIKCGGRTAVILPCGVDIAYPKTNRRLYERIINSGGAIISEYPPGVVIDKLNFRSRNRLFVGIADCTLVIEGTEGSGTMLTADCALSYGRRLYTVTSNITEKNSELPIRLLNSGVKAITSAYDIFSDFEEKCFSCINPAKIEKLERFDARSVIREFRLGIKIPAILYNETFEEAEGIRRKNWLLSVFSGVKTRMNVRDNSHIKSPFNTEPKINTPSDDELLSLGECALKIYKTLRESEKSTDELSGDFPFSEVLSTLTLLELHGYTETLPGGKIRIKTK